MKAGSLRHLLIIQERTETRSFGDVTEEWNDLIELPCELVSSTSREYFEAQKRNGEMTALFRIRYYEGIDAGQHRALFTMDPDASPVEYQVFDLFPPRHDNRRRETLIEAREVT